MFRFFGRLFRCLGRRGRRLGGRLLFLVVVVGREGGQLREGRVAGREAQVLPEGVRVGRCGRRVRNLFLQSPFTEFWELTREQRLRVCKKWTF